MITLMPGDFVRIDLISDKYHGIPGIVWKVSEEGIIVKFYNGSEKRMYTVEQLVLIQESFTDPEVFKDGIL